MTEITAERLLMGLNPAGPVRLLAMPPTGVRGDSLDHPESAACLPASRQQVENQAPLLPAPWSVAPTMWDLTVAGSSIERARSTHVSLDATADSSIVTLINQE